MTWKFGMVGALVVLLAAAGLQFYSMETPPYVGPSLAERLPSAMPGGLVRDEPVAATAEMKRAVDELLNYDDAVYRIYEKAGTTLGVYAARWDAGNMSPRRVGSHTPDNCWPLNGWIRRDLPASVAAETTQALDRCGFVHAEERLFEIGGQSQFVAFWHRVGDGFESYDSTGPAGRALWTEIKNHGLRLKQAQLFVRISSNRPLEEITSDADFRAVLRAVRNLGVAR